MSLYNKEAEISVIGAIMFDNNCKHDIFAEIAPDDFYTPKYKDIYSALLKLSESGDVIDLLTVDNATGGKYQSDILEITGNIVTSVNVLGHAKLIKDFSIRRAIVLNLQSIIKQASDKTANISDIIAGLESLALSTNGARESKKLAHVSEVGAETIKTMRERSAGEIVGVKTGLSGFDALGGGFQNTDLVVLAGRPAMGKTSLALTLALNAARSGPVAFFSLEMGAQQLYTRLLAMETGINTHHLFNGKLAETAWQKVELHSKGLNDTGLYINDQAQKTIPQILSDARRLKIKTGLNLIVVDYIQLVSSFERGASREQQISAISRGLKIIAKELNVPVLALSQLSRGVESREDKRPVLSDLRDSGAIEQDADIVTFIYRDDVYKKDAPSGKSEWIIGKYRNGTCVTVDLQFIPQQTKFVDYDPNDITNGGF